MRWYILRTLLHKEIRRHLANRGGIALAGLLVVAALLVSFFGNNTEQSGNPLASVHRCYLDYAREDDWIRHLRGNVPDELRGQVKFRNVAELGSEGELLTYPPGSGAIQIRTQTTPAGVVHYRVCLWHPDREGAGLARFEAWFWRESTHHFQRQAAQVLRANGQLEQSTAALPALTQERSQLSGAADLRSSITTALVLFALFFSCVYLLPSLMCEERERGVLLAQALSPASALEILTAKLMFYPTVGITLAALLAGITQPAVLINPVFWAAVLAAALGSLGIGLTIACLARTQRAASMAALSYMLMLALFLFLCQQLHIPGLPYLALEYHCPRVLHAVLAGAVRWYHFLNLALAFVLASGWLAAATLLFRKRGWQTC
jgi:hypothetical protein